MKRKEDQKICYQCSKIVETKKDHYVLLGTYNRSKSPDENCYFHFQCWVEYFMKRVNERAKIQVEGMQKMALSVFDNPMIKGLLSQIQGSGMALNMLKTPLHKEHEDVYHKKKILEIKKAIRKLKNGKKQKRAGKKRKAQMHKV